MHLNCVPWSAVTTEHRWTGACLFIVAVAPLWPARALAQSDAPQEFAKTIVATIGDPPTPVPAEFDSPRSTMRTFLSAMNPEQGGQGDLDKAIPCLDFSRVPSGDDRETLAKRLYKIINRIELVDLAALPDAEKITNDDQTRFQYFPNRRDNKLHQRVIDDLGADPVSKIVFARTSDGRWRFDAGTAAGINALYEQMEPLPEVAGTKFITHADWIEHYLPSTIVEQIWFGLKAWQWIALLLIILIGVAVEYAIHLPLGMATTRVIHRRGVIVEKPTVTRTVRTFSLFVAALVWLFLIQFLSLTGTPEKILVGAVKVFAILAAMFSLLRITDLTAEIFAEKAKNTATKIDDVLVPLLRKTVKIFVVVMSFVYGAQALDLNIWPLVASLGLGGVAFAFAAKDTVENFFGSIAVLLDRPFDVGDWIVVGDTEGIVEEVGFRSTRIRTFYNSQVTVPNANLVRAIVDNYGRRKYRRWKTYIGVQYDTTPDQLIAFTEGIRELVRTHPLTRKDYFQVYLNDFANSSLNILVYVFFEVDDWSTELRERERLFIDIVRLADQLGISFAFPTRTLHLFNEQHKDHEIQHPLPGQSADHCAQTHGIRAAHAVIQEQTWQSKKPGPVVFAEGPTQLDPVKQESDGLDYTEDRTAGA